MGGPEPDRGNGPSVIKRPTGHVAHPETAHTEYGGNRPYKRRELITQNAEYPHAVHNEEQSRALTEPEGRGVGLPHDALLCRRQSCELFPGAPRTRDPSNDESEGGEQAQNRSNNRHTRTIPLSRQGPQPGLKPNSLDFLFQPTVSDLKVMRAVLHDRAYMQFAVRLVNHDYCRTD